MEISPLPEGARDLQAVLAQVRSGAIHGLNVTIPHKQTVIPLLDALTPEAEAIGAVNTIFLRDGALTGHNTDAAGFIADAKKLSAFSWQGLALVLGAGGSARAVVYALLREGWQVAVSTRRAEQAEGISKQFAVFSKKPITTFQYPLTPYSLLLTPDLIVNTTPLGMFPNAITSPWPADLPFPQTAAVYDLVYNPRETKLVRDARRAGLPAMNGLGMLVEQAALAFKIWTGCAVRRDAIVEVISNK